MTTPLQPQQPVQRRRAPQQAPTAVAQVPAKPTAAPAVQPQPQAQAQVQPPAPVNPAAQAQQQAIAAQGQVQQGTDRVALAQQALRTLSDDLEPGFQQAQRQVGQNAAKFGRIGAGQTTNELTDLALARQRTLDSEAARLATDAAGQTLQDRLAIANSALGQFGAFSGDDRANEELALSQELGRGGLALQGELGRGGLAVDQGRLGVEEGRLAQDTVNSDRDFGIRDAELSLQGELGRGSLDLNRQQLGEDTRQFDASDQFRRLQSDRDFVLDDRLAEALAALEGFDLTGTGTTPALSPEEEQALQQIIQQQQPLIQTRSLEA